MLRFPELSCVIITCGVAHVVRERPRLQLGTTRSDDDPMPPDSAVVEGEALAASVASSDVEVDVEVEDEDELVTAEASTLAEASMLAEASAGSGWTETSMGGGEA